MTSISTTVTPPRRYMLHRDDGPTLQIVEWGSTTPRVTIVLAHGLALSHESWEDVAQLVVTADPTVRVLAYDHRGHGESQSAPANLELLADDLAAVVSAFAPTGPIVLGGHSMGGMTLMALAERHCAILGARVIGVAFVATAAGDVLGRLMRRRIWSRLVSLALTAAPLLLIPSRPLLIVRQLTRAVLFGARPYRHDLNRAVGQLARSDSRSVAELTRSILSHDRYLSLERFACRVVVLAGSRDLLTPAYHARAIHRRVPCSHLVIFQQSGHYLPYERRGEIAAHLLGLTLQMAHSGSDVA